jgi:DDE superfamily endonuclease
VAEVTAEQIRGVVARLVTAGHWRAGDPDVLIVCDAGYDLGRLAFLLADLPAQVRAGCVRTESRVCPCCPTSQARWAGHPTMAASSCRVATSAT